VSSFGSETFVPLPYQSPADHHRTDALLQLLSVSTDLSILPQPDYEQSL